jgi:rRNA maturation endonuclease Nob1
MTPTQMLKKLVDPADPAQVDEFYQHFRPTIKMDRALLCLDCESIFEAEGTQKCPACGSTIAWAIGRALNRQHAAAEEHAH